MLLVLAGAGSVRVVRGAWTDGAFPFIRSISIAISSRQIDESIPISNFKLYQFLRTNIRHLFWRETQVENRSENKRSETVKIDPK